MRSFQDEETLTLHADGPCREANFLTFSVNMKFKKCKCPIGFQMKTSEKAIYVCVCVIRDFTNTLVTECKAENQTSLRDGSFWIAYI